MNTYCNFHRILLFVISLLTVFLFPFFHEYLSQYKNLTNPTNFNNVPNQSSHPYYLIGQNGQTKSGFSLFESKFDYHQDKHQKYDEIELKDEYGDNYQLLGRYSICSGYYPFLCDNSDRASNTDIEIMSPTWVRGNIEEYSIKRNVNPNLINQLTNLANKNILVVSMRDICDPQLLIKASDLNINVFCLEPEMFEQYDTDHISYYISTDVIGIPDDIYYSYLNEEENLDNDVENNLENISKVLHSYLKTFKVDFDLVLTLDDKDSELVKYIDYHLENKRNDPYVNPSEEQTLKILIDSIDIDLTNDHFSNIPPFKMIIKNNKLDFVYGLDSIIVSNIVDYLENNNVSDGIYQYNPSTYDRSEKDWFYIKSELDTDVNIYEQILLKSIN